MDELEETENDVDVEDSSEMADYGATAADDIATGGDTEELNELQDEAAENSFAVSNTGLDTQELHQVPTIVAQEPVKNCRAASKRKTSQRTKERSTLLDEIKKGRLDRTKIIKTMLTPECENTKESDTAISMFFRSIAATVEQFPPLLQTRAKVKVLNVISQLEYENQQNVSQIDDLRPLSAANTPISPNASSYFSSYSPESDVLSPGATLPVYTQL